MAKKDKFFVGADFRKNRLAETETTIRAEVHKPGSPIKLYDNIHYPKALAKKIFRESPTVTHFVFTDTNSGAEEIITNTTK